VRPAMVVVVQ